MTKEDILRLRDTAEQTRVQFKERVTRDNKYDVSCEMVAQSNSRGGMIVVGIDDKTGRMNPLSFVEVCRLSRTALVNCYKAHLFDPQGKIVNNFSTYLPEPQSQII